MLVKGLVLLFMCQLERRKRASVRCLSRSVGRLLCEPMIARGNESSPVCFDKSVAVLREAVEQSLEVSGQYPNAHKAKQSEPGSSEVPVRLLDEWRL